MFFHGWYELLRVLIMASCAYIALVTILRISGKRTLSKMNAFDLVVTVALGSMFATIILSKDVALAEGILAFASLAALQFIVSWLSVRFPVFENLVKSEPALIVYRKEYLHQVMRKNRITETEVRTALRSNGITLESAEAVVMETDGSLTVVPTGEKAHSGILVDVTPDPKDL